MPRKKITTEAQRHGEEQKAFPLSLRDSVAKAFITDADTPRLIGPGRAGEALRQIGNHRHEHLWFNFPDQLSLDSDGNFVGYGVFDNVILSISST